MFSNEMNDKQPQKIIKVGSRKSKLAMIQTQMVIDELKHYFPDFQYVIKNIDTIGDHILDKPLAKIGEKALFTRELEEELLSENIDIIVHSLKDLPTTLPEKCCIGAILKREDPSDSLVLRRDLKNSYQDLKSILKESQDIKCFGTSSLRRLAQLKSLMPSNGITVKDVRGNLNTRLDKLDNYKVHGYDCLILATAGLKRSGYNDRITLKLDWYHAVSQGALGVECRLNDSKMFHILQPLIDQKSALECTAERVLMKCLEGGCSVPIGVRTYWDHGFRLTLQAKVLSLDGQQSVSAECSRDLDDHNDSNSDIFVLDDYTGIHFNNHNESDFSTKLKNSVLIGKDLAQKMIDLGVKTILNKK